MYVRFHATARMSAHVTPNLRALKGSLRALPIALVTTVGVLAIATIVEVLGVAVYVMVNLIARMRARDHRHATAGSLSGERENADLLEQLHHLHDSGNLSDAEYSRQREKILAAS